MRREWTKDYEELIGPDGKRSYIYTGDRYEQTPNPADIPNPRNAADAGDPDTAGRDGPDGHIRLARFVRGAALGGGLLRGGHRRV